MEETEPRLLKGHKATATCCVASRSRPGLVATAGEDGRVCWFDMRCKDVLLTMDVGNSNPVSSICFKPENEEIIYVSTENEVKTFDVRMASSWELLESYSYNKDEINQITCNSKSSFLAAADDGGDIKIIDIRQHCLYKTLRAGHRSICSSVQFLPWRPWEVITGGLDSRLVLWDFSKGRPQRVLDFGASDAGSSGDGEQCLNPAFVHGLVVPESDMVDKVGKMCAVARGDGAVDVINIESELAGLKPQNPSKQKKSLQGTSKCTTPQKNESQDQENRKLHLDYSLGGHTAAVSCVTFSMFGEKGKFIISGSNDKSVKVWDWSTFFDSGGGSSSNLLDLDLKLKRKVNWLTTTPTDSDNLVICDTSRVVKVYTIK